MLTRPTDHPAASLPESQRLSYVRIIAAMALADGLSVSEELGRLQRLSDLLQVPAATFEAMLLSLKDHRLDAPVTRDAVDAFRHDERLRASLMMDAIAIAFVDGQLAQAESHQLATLATSLGFSNSDVLRMARLAERVLFQRSEAEQQELTREFADVLHGPTSGLSLFFWIRGIFGG